MTGRRDGAAERGFSLVEMLVSLAMLGLAAALLGSGIVRMQGHIAATKAIDARAQTVKDAQFLLRRRIERLRPVADMRGGGVTIDAAGDASRLEFIGDGPEGSGADALRRFRLQRAADGALLLLDVSTLDARLDLRDPATRGWRVTRLVEGTDGLSFLYFGPPRTGSGLRWQTSWSGRRQPPLLIRIDVAFPQGDARTWPELVVRPRVNGVAGCQVNVDSGLCGADS